MKEPQTHPAGPMMVTGTSVLGIKYRDGVLLAADRIGSYGSNAKYFGVCRLHPLGASTVLGTSGDIADMQETVRKLRTLLERDGAYDDGSVFQPRQLFRTLQHSLYQRRTKLDPLWNTHVVGGLDVSGESFLGVVTHRGVFYEEDSVATGLGAYLALPLLRKALATSTDSAGQNTLEEAQAITVLEECLQVLYYRDGRASDWVQLAKISREGAFIFEPHRLTTDWSIARHSPSNPSIFFPTTFSE